MIGQPFAAKLSLAAAWAFVVCLVSLHVLRPDLDPSWRLISEYELGPYGWVMRLAFLSLAVSCLSLGFALFRQARGASGVIGLVLLAVSGVGMVLAAVYAPDKVNRLHELGAMLDNVPFAALLINWSLGRNERWFPARGILRWTCTLPLLGLALFIGAMAMMLPSHGGKPGPEVLVGWPNRVMILLHCAWLIPLAAFAARLPAADVLTSRFEGAEAPQTA